MTKQEEIREGIRDIADVYINSDSEMIYQNFVNKILEYLDSVDCMLKVKCPDCEWAQFGEEHVGMTPCYSCNSTGYIFELLVEEIKK